MKLPQQEGAMQTLLMFSLSLVILGTGSAAAYNGPTHSLTVTHAFTFMVNSEAGTGYRYPDGWTSDKDRFIALQWAGPLAGRDEIAVRLNVTAQTLAKAAKETDQLEDVYLCSNHPALVLVNGWRIITSGSVSRAGSVRCGTHLDDFYFTALSHFINAPRPRDFWEKNGYYFPWVQQLKECEHFGRENHAVLHGWAWIDKSQSLPYSRYAADLLVSRGEYERNFDQYLRDTRLWPVDVMADFWYREFLGSPALNSLPQYVVNLGPVLHAVQDATVPFHAVGVSGCGHGDYEAYVEVLYNETQGLLYDPHVIKEYLTREPFLTTRTPVKELIRRLADTAAATCSNTLGGSECGKINDSRRAKNLVNLAIAANVVVLRKAWIEWQERITRSRRGFSPVPGLGHAVAPSRNRVEHFVLTQYQGDGPVQVPKGPGQTQPSTTDTERRDPRGSQTKDPEDSVRGAGSKFTTIPAIEVQPGPEYLRDVERRRRLAPDSYDFRSISREAIVSPFLSAYGGVVTSPIDGMRVAISGFREGALDETTLRAQLGKNQGALTSFFKTIQYKELPGEKPPPHPEVGLPRVGVERRPIFRLPTGEEVQDEGLWTRYVSSRKLYVNSVSLMRLGVNKAALQAEIDIEKDPKKREELLGILKDMVLLENELVRSIR